jgi:hypothetical protein
MTGRARGGGTASRERSAPRSSRPAARAAADPNEEIVIRPYMRGTLALLAALPADGPVDDAALARAVGRRTAAWSRFVAQLLELRLADDVGIDRRPLLLVTPAGLMLREQLCRGPRRTLPGTKTLLERLGLEPLAILEALAELGPLRLADVVAGCHLLPGNNREPPLARSRFAGLTRHRHLAEIVPGDEVLEPGLRRYHATDTAWRIVAARRRLHPTAYDLGAFAGWLTAVRATAGRGRGEPVRLQAPPRRRRRSLPIPGQLSLF